MAKIRAMKMKRQGKLPAKRNDSSEFDCGESSGKQTDKPPPKIQPETGIGNKPRVIGNSLEFFGGVFYRRRQVANGFIRYAGLHPDR